MELSVFNSDGTRTRRFRGMRSRFVRDGDWYVKSVAVEVRGIGLLSCDFGRKSRRKLGALDGFVSNEVGRARWSFRFRNDLYGFACLQVTLFRRPSFSEELKDMSSKVVGTNF